jgi:hypothetical protein
VAARACSVASDSAFSRAASGALGNLSGCTRNASFRIVARRSCTCDASVLGRPRTAARAARRRAEDAAAPHLFRGSWCFARAPRLARQAADGSSGEPGNRIPVVRQHSPPRTATDARPCARHNTAAAAHGFPPLQTSDATGAAVWRCHVTKSHPRTEGGAAASSHAASTVVQADKMGSLRNEQRVSVSSRQEQKLGHVQTPASTRRQPPSPCQRARCAAAARSGGCCPRSGWQCQAALHVARPFGHSSCAAHHCSGASCSTAAPSSCIRSPATMLRLCVRKARAAAVRVTKQAAYAASCMSGCASGPRRRAAATAQATKTAVVPAKTSPCPPQRRGEPSELHRSAGAAAPDDMTSACPFCTSVHPWRGGCTSARGQRAKTRALAGMRPQSDAGRTPSAPDSCCSTVASSAATRSRARPQQL